MTTTSEQPTELELLRRLMNSSPLIPVERATEVVVGKLPAALADEVPLPSGARLVGSLLSSHQGRLADLQVVLDATGSPAEVMSAYEQELRERGWDAFEDMPGPMHGGFRPGPATDSRMLRRGAEGPVLMLAAVAIDEALTDLRLRLDWEMPRRLGEMGSHPMGMSGFNRIPRLHPPRGVSLEPRGGGGGDGRWHSEARVDTDLSVVELEAHFASQLVATGWTRVSGRADDVVGWSSWLVPGEGGWRGLLLVLAPFGDRERSLTLRIEETKPEGGESWGQGSSFSSITARH